MASFSSCKAVLIFSLIQLNGYLLSATDPKDNIQRRGIVLQLFNRGEFDHFKTEVELNGVTYVHSPNKRFIEFGDGNYLAVLSKYCRKDTPLSCGDMGVFTKLSGEKRGQVIMSAVLTRLANDDDLKMAVIPKVEPAGLEFVMSDQQCAFVAEYQNVPPQYYDCSNDNYQHYT